MSEPTHVCPHCGKGTIEISERVQAAIELIMLETMQQFGNVMCSAAAAVAVAAQRKAESMVVTEA